MNKLSSLSIFFPAFNEEVNIKIVVKQALDLAPKVSQKFEILVIDDGSVDKTADVVSAMAKQHKQIRLVQHKVNMGYGNALKTGLYNSKFRHKNENKSSSRAALWRRLFIINKEAPYRLRGVMFSL